MAKKNWLFIYLFIYLFFDESDRKEKCFNI